MKTCSLCKKRQKETQFVHVEKYISKLIERVMLREHAPMIKGIDRIAKEALSALIQSGEVPVISVIQGYEVKVRFIPKVTVSKKKV